MRTAEELVLQAYELDPGNLARLGEWCESARKCLGVRDIGGHRFCTSVAFPHDAIFTAAEMRLAYILGRIESDLFETWDNRQRKQQHGARRKSGRIREDQDGYTPTDEYKAEVSAYGHRLKAQGVRNFRKLTAEHFEQTPINVARWMKRWPG